MFSFSAGRLVRSLWRDTTIKSIVVCLFFVCVFANVTVLIVSHLGQDSDVIMIDPVGARDTWDLSDVENVDFKDFKLKSLLSLRACIRDKMRLSQNNSGGLPTSFVMPSYKNMLIPPAVDEDILASFKWTTRREFRRLKSIFKFLSRPVLNNHDFQYIHNPEDTCVKRKISLVIAVPSSPGHMGSRDRTRQGLKGSYVFNKNNNATLLFFLGRSTHQNKSRKFQVDINMEMRTFGDIVQENFIDVYQNLTLKTISVLKWIDRFCPQAQFVIKADDDAAIKPAQALSALQRYRENFGNFILGQSNPKIKVQRNESSKIFVPYEEYPHSTFPPHLLGGAMGFPVSTARLLFQAALRVKRVRLDDVFISGLCAPMVNVPIFMDADFNFIHRQW